jgi:hypothetical protein
MERRAILGIISFLQEQEDDDHDEFVMFLNTVQVDLIIFSNFSSFKLFMNLHSFVWESGGGILIECLYS